MSVKWRTPLRAEEIFILLTDSPENESMHGSGEFANYSQEWEKLGIPVRPLLKMLINNEMAGDWEGSKRLGVMYQCFHWECWVPLGLWSHRDWHFLWLHNSKSSFCDVLTEGNVICQEYLYGWICMYGLGIPQSFKALHEVKMPLRHCVVYPYFMQAMAPFCTGT